MNITTAAADLAKNLITVCAQDACGRTVELTCLGFSDQS